MVRFWLIINDQYLYSDWNQVCLLGCGQCHVESWFNCVSDCHLGVAPYQNKMGAWCICYEYYLMANVMCHKNNCRPSLMHTQSYMLWWFCNLLKKPLKSFVNLRFWLSYIQLIIIKLCLSNFYKWKKWFAVTKTKQFLRHR